MAKARPRKRTESKTNPSLGAEPPRSARKKSPSGTKAQSEARGSNRAPEIIEPEIIDTQTLGTSESDVYGDAPVIDPDEFGYDEALSEPDLDPDSEVADPALVLKDQGVARASVQERTLEPEIIEKSDSSSRALTTADPVATYLAEIRRYPLLTKEQERELAIRYRETGDPKAAELLVTSNLRFVVKIAAEYSRFGAKLIDLIQEGNVGLMHAVREFNPYRGVRLITYAVWWIRGYIQEYLMRQYSMVRIGTTQNQRKLFYRLQRERESLDAAGHEPNVALLAGRLGVSEEEVETMTKRLSGRDVSLNQPLGGSDSTASLLDFEASTDTAVDEELGHREELQMLLENIEKIRPNLSEKEKYILEKRLLADEPFTLQEIGHHYGITREAVRQLEARLIGKIRTAFANSMENKDEDES